VSIAATAAATTATADARRSARPRRLLRRPSVTDGIVPGVLGAHRAVDPEREQDERPGPGFTDLGVGRRHRVGIVHALGPTTHRELAADPVVVVHHRVQGVPGIAIEVARLGR
jgi:hypothetical protein